MRALLATLASALIIVLASVVVGRAAMRVLGRREATWLEPALGLAILMLAGSLTIRAFDGGGPTAIVLGALVLVSLVILRLRVMAIEDLRVAALPALLAAALAMLPLLASMRVGILGIGVNNDLASHLLWADWLRDQSDPIPGGLAGGYPIGPHSIAAAIAEAFSFEMTEAIIGLLIATAAITAITALSALAPLAPWKRALGGALTALPYMAASALAVGGFKETVMAVMLLAFALTLSRLEDDWPGTPALWVTLALFAAATLSVYSYPGLYWLIAAAGLALVAGAIRAQMAGELGDWLRRAAPLAGIAALVFAAAAATELDRARTFNDISGVQIVIESDAKLRESVSPLETLGAWPGSDFLAGTEGVEAYALFGALGVAALVAGSLWWLRQRSLAVPLAVLGALVIYIGSLLEAGLYVQSKALAVPAPLVMLLILRGLLDPDPVRSNRRDMRQRPGAGPRTLIGRRPVRALLAGAFIAVAGYSSFLALRDAVVAPNEHGDELAAFHDDVDGTQTLSLTTDRFTDYHLRSTRVGSPARNAQVVVDSRRGKDFRLPLDFDSVDSEALDKFSLVLVTRAAYRSQPQSNLEMVHSTDSYELWRRTGPTPPNFRVFGEEARPGKVLQCRRRDVKIGLKRLKATSAVVFRPRPVIGKRLAWEPGGAIEPGESASQTLDLPPGQWDLSLQYQSALGELEIDVAGQSLELPAAMDGAIPFRLGEGPFWPVGRINSEGGPVEITATAEESGAIQRLLGVDRPAALGNLVATQPGASTEIPFGEACGEYVDHYEVPLAVALRNAS